VVGMGSTRWVDSSLTRVMATSSCKPRWKSKFTKELHHARARNRVVKPCTERPLDPAEIKESEACIKPAPPIEIHMLHSVLGPCKQRKLVKKPAGMFNTPLITKSGSGCVLR
jgi:hypothetical protein